MNTAIISQRDAYTVMLKQYPDVMDIEQMPGMELVRTIAAMFAMYHDIKTEIIAASVRSPIHVIDCALAGADIATVPYNVIEQMTKHPLTDAGIAKFKTDYLESVK